MNIKEHIDAGHYPKDEKGRALVPVSDGRTAIVLATDAPISAPIVGWMDARWDFPVNWNIDGTSGGSYGQSTNGAR